MNDLDRKDSLLFYHCFSSYRERSWKPTPSLGPTFGLWGRSEVGLWCPLWWTEVGVCVTVPQKNFEVRKGVAEAFHRRTLGTRERGRPDSPGTEGSAMEPIFRNNLVRLQSGCRVSIQLVGCPLLPLFRGGPGSRISLRVPYLRLPCQGSGTGTKSPPVTSLDSRHGQGV